MRLFLTNTNNYSDNLKINNNRCFNVLGLKLTEKFSIRNVPAGTNCLYLYQSYFIPLPVK